MPLTQNDQIANPRLHASLILPFATPRCQRRVKHRPNPPARISQHVKWICAQHFPEGFSPRDARGVPTTDCPCGSVSLASPRDLYVPLRMWWASGGAARGMPLLVAPLGPSWRALRGRPPREGSQSRSRLLQPPCARAGHGDLQGDDTIFAVKWGAECCQKGGKPRRTGPPRWGTARNN